ncbi:F-box domain-containing protein [Favolaschia claudopus]|uniref:F-box domain-containing protein n=1 Tax=Favolaschia claudopus TaxID=2862362 RepID=A0AAW0DS62_9AGAR
MATGAEQESNAKRADFESEAKEIEAQIAWHYYQIAILKAKRNAIVPIRRLPNELMIRILTIFAVECESDGLFSLRWTRILTVCQHWHALGLSAQHLWASIDLKWTGTTRRLFTQLKRSGAAPLAIQLNLSHRSQHYIYSIMEHSSRIRDLDLDGRAKYIFEFISHLPSLELDNLSTLSLDGSVHQDEISETLSQSLPHNLFDEKLDRLQSLSLNSIAFPWSALRGLTVLSLVECDDTSQSIPPTCAELLDMLSASPQLQELALHHMCPPLIPDDIYPIVHLPNLKWLQLRDPVECCQALIEHLRIPCHASISLFPYGLQSGPDIRNILVPIRKHIRSPGAKRPLLLKVDRSDTEHCTVYFHCTTTPPIFFSSDEKAYPLMLNCHPDTEASLRRMLTKVIKAVPATFITHLDGRAGSIMGEVTWRTVIMLLPSLEKIYLFLDKAAINCVRALRQIEAMDAAHRGASPRILQLHIRVIPKEEGDAIPRLFTALEDYLQVAREHNSGKASLKTLEFDDPRFALSVAGELKFKRLFELMDGEIILRGEIYDPIKRAEELAELRKEQQALRIELGLDIE